MGKSGEVLSKKSERLGSWQYSRQVTAKRNGGRCEGCKHNSRIGGARRMKGAKMIDKKRDGLQAVFQRATCQCPACPG